MALSKNFEKARLLFLSIAILQVAAGRTRYYEWNITYATVAPDGVAKLLPTVNGQVPGPTVYAVNGDRVQIKACNGLSMGMTLHWHGIHMTGQQWMDGPSMGTQCPVQPGNCFTYNFKILNQLGTYWYHGHFGILRSSIFGALVIYPRRTDPAPIKWPANEFVLLIGDWYHKGTDELQASLLNRTFVNGKESDFPPINFGDPDSILINGKGYLGFSNNSLPCGDCTRNQSACSKLSRFSVKRGLTYRFRVVNIGLWAQLSFSIQDHHVTLVMADGNYLEPQNFSAIEVYPGQTFDFLVTMNQKAGNFWVYAKGRFDSAASKPPGLAILQYESSSKTSNGYPLTPYVCAPDTDDFGQQLTFKSMFPVAGLSTWKVQKRFSIMQNVQTVNNLVRVAINNVSFVAPTTPLLAAEYYNLPGVFDELPGNFTPQGTILGLLPAKSGSSVLTVTRGQFIEIIIQNHGPPGGNHPWHIHGNNFYVVGWGFGDYGDTELPPSPLNLVNPPSMSTAILYDGTWIALRFWASSVGVWNFHCHLDPHTELGMQLFLRIKGPANSIPPPPNDFPKCGLLAR